MQITGNKTRFWLACHIVLLALLFISPNTGYLKLAEAAKEASDPIEERVDLTDPAEVLPLTGRRVAVRSTLQNTQTIKRVSFLAATRRVMARRSSRTIIGHRISHELCAPLRC